MVCLGAFDIRPQLNKAARRKLSTDRIGRLDEIGFDWDPRVSAWESMFRELKSYVGKFGDCDVPDKWSENPKLASWVGTQRSLKRKNRLPTDREARLNGIGFNWSPHGSKWRARLEELVIYKSKYGNCDVPVEWPQDPRLGTWVHLQRQLAKAGKLSHERKARLDALGFDWTPRANKRRVSPLAAE
jgi:hypothetical protein